MKLKIKILFIFLISTLLAGCSDFLSDNSQESQQSTFRISNLSDNDTIGFHNTLTFEGNELGSLLFIELYVNGVYVTNYFPKDVVNNSIYVYLENKYLNNKVELYLVYYNKENKSFKSPSIFLNVSSSVVMPFKPYSLATTRINDNSILVTWIDSTQGEPQFELFKKKFGESEYMLYKVFEKGTNNFIDEDANIENIFFYKIRTKISSKYSDYSFVVNSLGGIGEINILPPSKLKATILNIKTIQLNWQNNSIDDNYYKIERRESYTAYSTIGIVQKNTNQFLDSINVYPNKEYFYKVKVFSSKDSSSSVEISVTTPGYILASPNLTSGKVEGDSVIVINWSDNEPRYANYELFRKTNSGDYELLVTVDGYLSFYKDSNITKGNTYSYMVRLNDGFYKSEFSNSISVLY